MPTVYKNAQVQGTASSSTYATLYSTSSSQTAVISTILVTNTASAGGTYRIAIMDTAGTPSAANWLVFDGVVPANDAIAITVGITMGSSKFMRVSSSANTISFNAFVSEIS
jgi:hypothetical protein